MAKQETALRQARRPKRARVGLVAQSRLAGPVAKSRALVVPAAKQRVAAEELPLAAEGMPAIPARPPSPMTGAAITHV
jgi:hypothetical protein